MYTFNTWAIESIHSTVIYIQYNIYIRNYHKTENVISLKRLQEIAYTSYSLCLSINTTCDNYIYQNRGHLSSVIQEQSTLFKSQVLLEVT